MQRWAIISIITALFLAAIPAYATTEDERIDFCTSVAAGALMCHRGQDVVLPTQIHIAACMFGIQWRQMHPENVANYVFQACIATWEKKEDL